MDCREYREAAGATAENLICLTEVKVLSSSVIKLLRMELSVKFTVIQRCNAHGTLN